MWLSLARDGVDKQALDIPIGGMSLVVYAYPCRYVFGPRYAAYRVRYRGKYPLKAFGINRLWLAATIATDF